MTPLFKKVLVANRGEIAVRVIRACRELGIPTVAVFSEVDRPAAHVRAADEAYCIGPAPSRESYLRIDKLLEVARLTGSDAVHPGYGFLAERADFARACEEAGITFIGPTSDTIALMGEKTSARRLAVEAGVPVVPGTLEPIADPEEIAVQAKRIGYPIMLKAAAGGGGKGLRLVERPEDLAAATQRAKSEAQSAFGDDSVYLEKAILRPRHIEIQVLGDHHGNAVHLFERECSIQRRHQKIVEESPSPFVTEHMREQMGEAAVALVKRIGYRNAGTLEFLADAERNFYFLEMNTRIQVEHPVTEMVTGTDLVKLQLRIAAGERLPFTQKDLSQRGHAIECRVYAEDPDRGFMPSPGRITALRVPGGPGVRDDSGVYEGYEVPVHYDSMLSKVIAYGVDRDDAIRRMRRVLEEYRVLGVKTTLPFLERVLHHDDFVKGDFDTSFVEKLQKEKATARGGLRAEERSELPDDRTDVAIAAAAIRTFKDRKEARILGESAGPTSAWREAGWRERMRDRG